MTLATIEIDKIEIGNRLRDISEAQVETLIASIGDVGLLNPVTVYPRETVVGGMTVPGFGLVAGAHRLEACKRLGLADIAAQVVNLSDLERQIAECDENLCATTLSKSERALFTKRRKEAYEALHPETKNGVIGAIARHAPAKLADASFTADTAAKTGQSERSIQRDAERGERITPAALALTKGTALDTGSFLDRLKKVDTEKQVAFVRAELDERKAPKPAKRAPHPKNANDVHEAQVAALMSAWNKASHEARQDFLARIDTPVFDRSAA